jgi:hypothetical protein
LYTFDPTTGGLVIPDNAVNSVNPFYPTNIPIETASKAGYPANSLVNMDKHNIQPRIGVAYSPFGGKTVFRAGYGIYSNLIYASLARSQMEGGPFSGSVTYTNSTLTNGEFPNGKPLFSFPSPFLPSGKTATQNVTGVNPNLKTPYTQEWEASVEHQIGQYGLRISYLGSRTDQLAYDRNFNQPPPSTTPFSSSEYFYPLYNQIAYADSGGNAFYNALELSAQKTYGHNLTLSANFTWARDLTDTQEGSNWGGQLLQNQFCRACEKANNLDTLPVRFNIYGLYALPLGQGQRFLSNLHGPLQQALGGWRAAWSVIMESGPFFSPAFSGQDPSNTNLIGGRPDVVPGVSKVPSGGRTVTEWFNPAAFKIPGCPDATPVCKTPADIGRFGDAAIGALQAPHIRNLDANFVKQFNLGEHARLQLIFNFSNILNHPNFAVPGANISSAGTVGVISAQAVFEPALPKPREIDFGARLEF